MPTPFQQQFARAVGVHTYAGYEPPEEITKCGKRKCSVGKLKGRAEEARKAEMYDEMGADLLRALSKPIDQEQVTTRLHRDLERAFDGIGRQRQREEEERLEQEKVDRFGLYS